MDKRTGAKSKIIEGVTWHCYHTGILRYEWRTESGLCAAGSNYNKATYYAVVGSERFQTRFRSLEAAMRFAIKTAQRR